MQFLSHKYPWNLFLKLFAAQIIFFNLWLYIVESLLNVFGSNHADFISFNVSYFIGTFLISSFISHFFSRPMSRIIHKALFLSSKRWARELGPVSENLLVSEMGEFAEIENALNKIERKIKKSRDLYEKEKEEIRVLLGSVEDSLASFGLDGRLMFFNSHFARLFLKTPQLLKSDSTFITDIFRIPELFEGFEAVKDSGQAKRIVLKLSNLENSYSHYYVVSFSPLRHNVQGQIYGVTAVFHDITEIKQAEQIRIDFVGNASHELRTPLTTIKGYAETLKEDFTKGKINSQSEKFLNIILRNANRLIELVNDMLEIQTLESKPEIQLEKVDAQEITLSVVNDLRFQSGEKKQSIDIQLNGVSELNGDREKIGQVLRNLIGNAIKYSYSESQINVIWEADLQGTILKVIDDGPGIPENHLGRLFERFYRVDQGRSREHGGTGLGLAIVKHIMQSHGGSVSVKSSLGSGSEFKCVFPRSVHPK